LVCGWRTDTQVRQTPLHPGNVLRRHRHEHEAVVAADYQILDAKCFLSHDRPLTPYSVSGGPALPVYIVHRDAATKRTETRNDRVNPRRSSKRTIQDGGHEIATLILPGGGLA
jgi:hypothetical protein